MTKKDLKNGMVVEVRRGKKFLIHNERCIDKFGGFPIRTMNDDLKDIDDNKDWDIVKVYNSKALSILGLFDNDSLELIWERDVEDNVNGEDIIKVGDKVKVIDNGEAYTTNTRWVTREIESEDLRYRYDYDVAPSESDTYRVIHIAEHNGLFVDETLAYIKKLSSGKCYLIDIVGLKKVD